MNLFQSNIVIQGSSASKDDTEHFILDDVALEPWSSKRLGILSKYTTSEKLSITTVSHMKILLTGRN
jgi:hypothetical protein